MLTTWSSTIMLLATLLRMRSSSYTMAAICGLKTVKERALCQPTIMNTWKMNRPSLEPCSSRQKQQIYSAVAGTNFWVSHWHRIPDLFQAGEGMQYATHVSKIMMYHEVS